MMKVVVFILLASILCLLCPTAQAQRILLVEKPGKFKNYKYFMGDDITVKTHTHSKNMRGTIHDITDTSIVINFDTEIMLDDIEKILRPRWGLGLLSKITRIAGAGYFAIDVVNNAISNRPPIVDENTVIISASLVAFSYALVPFHNRRLKAENQWRIKVLNMSMDDEVPNPFLR
jgi:hypothetical protein